MTLFPRSSGILLHPTSLPGPYGIGDLGEWAYRFVDWLEANAQTIWQVLPLGPTSYGDSPYQTLSTFAGNANLISLDRLVEAGWLSEDALADLPDSPADRVDYGAVGPAHDRLLDRAYAGFEAAASPEEQAAFDTWRRGQGWLDEFALFITLKEKNESRPWVEWPEGEALRDADTLASAREALGERIRAHMWRQWVFDQQWQAVKAYANEKGIRLFGDVPIFVAHDSADVWANQGEYYLDERGQPTVVAGVPPDYFSETGQRWGNPLYRWDVMKANGYRWWIERFRAILNVVDYIRIDHFRGFEAYWEIPADEETAVNGEWVPGPAADLFDVVARELGELPFIAEDLGVITEGVEELRDGFDLPGMKVLQFAWGSGPKNPFLPHNHTENSVVYSGTHDNNTTLGWWQEEADSGVRDFMAAYLDAPTDDPLVTLMRVGMRSPAHTFIMPMQDVLGLGAEARMNTPGNPAGNWTWRFTSEQLETRANSHLPHLTWLYQRRPDQQIKEYGDAAMQPGPDLPE